MVIDYQFNPDIMRTDIRAENENSNDGDIESNHNASREEERGREIRISRVVHTKQQCNRDFGWEMLKVPRGMAGPGGFPYPCQNFSKRQVVVI